MAIASAGVTCRVAPHDRILRACVESVARAANRPVRSLHLQALLQLPRVADRRGIVPAAIADALLHDLAGELPGATEWLVRRSASWLGSLHFREIDDALARDVMERFHCLRSPRTDGRGYRLTTDAGRLVALCVSSPLDVAHLCDLLALHGRSNDGARVVSRVFALEGAPKNSISYLLSRVARAEARRGVTDFVTYVNPNMGFTGSSYRASGWLLLGNEPGTTYRYLDGRYITDHYRSKA